MSGGITGTDMTSRDILKKLVDIAMSQVGVKEEGGNNCGTKITEYQKETWLEPGPWPWCSAFVCWCLREWLYDKDVCSALNIKNEMQKQVWRNQDASAFGWEKWAKKRNLHVLSEIKTARMGDIVVFDFAHVGIVVSDQEYIADPIETVEGNTNGKGERDSVSGDGVWKKFRASNLVKCYIRLLEDLSQ